MRRWPVIALLVSGLDAASAEAQPVVASPAPQSVAVTIYRDPDREPADAMQLRWLNGFALITERRRVSLSAGESVVRFEGVAAGIVPQSAIVTGFPDGVVERNRDAYLLSPATLIDRSLGERVHLRRTSAATGEVREEDAVVRTGADGAVLIETSRGVEALRCTGLNETLVYDRLPQGLSARPTLSVRTRATAPVEAEVTLSYLATGFDWQADYVANLSADGRHIELFAWLTLGSTDETSFVDAQTQAVAGRLNYTRAQAPPAEGGALQLRCWPQRSTSDIPLEAVVGSEAFLPPPAPNMITVTGSRIGQSDLANARFAQQEELGDLKLYRLPDRVTVAANAQKQVALLRRGRVQVQTVYRSRLIPNVQRGMAQESRADRYLISRNDERAGLGLPLPQGRVVLFTQQQRRPILIGEGALADRAVGDDVEINFGPAPGIVVVAEHVRDGSGSSDFLVRVTNDQPRPVRYEASFEPGPGFTPSTPLAIRDGRPLWAVTIPANGMAILRYRLDGRAR